MKKEMAKRTPVLAFLIKTSIAAAFFLFNKSNQNYIINFLNIPLIAGNYKSRNTCWTRYQAMVVAKYSLHLTNMYVMIW